MLKRVCLSAIAAVFMVGCATVHPVGNAASKVSPEAAWGAIEASPMVSAPLDGAKTYNRIVFASCAKQLDSQDMWTQIASENPDLTLFIGDNVYGDVYTNDPALPELKAAYMRLAMSEPFKELRLKAPMLTVWDDHDYGMNDAGGDYQYKKQSEELFEFVWALSADDPRRERDGVYGSWILGENEGERLQIIMLDTRYFRSPLKETDEKGAKGKERYLPDADPNKTMLGDAQWAWLADELKKPADVRLIVSSIQVIAEGHGWEAWKTLPAEREKLYRTIDEADAKGVVLLSGDRHSAALYRRDGVIDYPLFEATSSSVNLPASKWRAESGETYVEPGPHRLGDMIYDANYGVVDIDWAKNALTFEIRDEDGDVVLSELVDLSKLR